MASPYAGSRRAQHRARDRQHLAARTHVETRIEALLEQGAGDLTIVSNNCGVDGAGLGLLLEAHRISRVIASGRGVVSRVITDLGVFDVTGAAFGVVELAPGVQYADVVAKTAAPVTDGR